MLVLTRKSNQSIMIGDEIEVSVLAIMGEKVRIGIQAPRTIPSSAKRSISRSSRSAERTLRRNRRLKPPRRAEDSTPALLGR
jgi:carbon storage regulator CsrA